MPVSSPLFAGEMIVGDVNKLHCAGQILFVPRHEGHVPFLRRPAVRTRFAFGENPRLIALGQSNIAMPMTVNVHEHCSADEKSVFMDSSVLALGHVGQTENPPSQFLMKVSRFHVFFDGCRRVDKCFAGKEMRQSLIRPSGFSIGEKNGWFIAGPPWKRS